MKKKFLAMGLCVMISSAMLTGCSKDNISFFGKSSIDEENKDAEENQPDADSKALKESSENNEDAVDKTEENTEAKTDDAQGEVTGQKKAPVLKIAYKNYYEMYDGDKTFTPSEDEISQDYSNGLLYEGKEAILLMDDASKDDYPELYETLMNNANGVMANADEFAKNETESAKTDYETAIDEGYSFYGPYESKDDIYIRRADSEVLSYEDYNYTYTGGAHGMGGCVGVNYDAATGQEIKLKDVVTVSEEELNELIKNNLKESNAEAEFDDLDAALGNYKFEPNPDFDNDVYEYDYNWYLGYDGVHFIFNPYEIAAYAYGSFDAVVSFEEHKDIFNEKYVPSSAGGYIERANLSLMDSEYVGEDEPGMYLKYLRDGDIEDSEVYASNLTLVKDGKEATIEEPFFVSFNGGNQIYKVVTSDGREYIYFTASSFNDYYELYVFDITGDKVEAVGTTGYHYEYEDLENSFGANPVLNDPDNMHFAQVSDSFGTFIYRVESKVGSNGMPESKNDNFIIKWGSSDMVSKAEITGDMVDEDGNILTSSTTLPAGTHVIPYKTDCKTYVDCKLDDGQLLRLYYENASYPATLEGGAVDDLFDGILYAG